MTYTVWTGDQHTHELEIERVGKTAYLYRFIFTEQSKVTKTRWRTARLRAVIEASPGTSHFEIKKALNLCEQHSLPS